MSPPPRASVIVAAYEAQDHLHEALASARAQTLRDIEILVVDDASTDATGAIARRHADADPRVEVLTMAANGGPGAARNLGLARARGEWVAMLDADDTFDPQRLDALVALGEAAGSDMVADNLTLIEAGRPPRPLLPMDGPWPMRPTPLSFIAGNQGAHGQDRILLGFLKPLIRRAFLARHRLRYRDLRLAEDYFLYLEALLSGAVWHIVGEGFYNYAVRETSLSGTFGAAELDAMAEADRRLLKAWGARLDPQTAAAVAGHRRAVRTAAAWTRMVRAVRSRRPLALLRALPLDAAMWGPIASETMQAAPRILRRLRLTGPS